MILQEIKTLGRKVDGNALQNAEILVQLEDLRKCVKESGAEPNDDCELLEVIPVQTAEELFELAPRITNDPNFRKQMVSSVFV